MSPHRSIGGLPAAEKGMHFKHIAIVGVGLIGGSFALAARRAGICERITGWDNREALDQALARGVIDDVEDAFGSGSVSSISDADLVYLATPVGAIISFLRTHAASLKFGVVITDAGSTKRDICRAAREALPREVSFIGGHPMAGSERTGVEFADADLFQGAAYALVAEEGARTEAVNDFTDIVNRIGARPVFLTAERHDQIAARVSQSPQLISTALALAAARAKDADTLSLSGSGLVAMTRLAQSRWSVWEDICRTNADEIASALDEAIAEMETVRTAIASGDFASAGDMFIEAGEYARVLRETRRGRVIQSETSE
jgi:prephenate dehydrogenase